MTRVWFLCNTGTGRVQIEGFFTGFQIFHWILNFL
jgi:hypothetical protein